MGRRTAHEDGPSNGLLLFLTARDDTTNEPIAVVAAGLLIAVCIIHLQDQGGLLGGESPIWLKWGYYLVELTSLLAAVMILRKRVIGWILGLGATGLPFVGYLLSRSVGIPGDSGDIGNWGYMLGTVSLIVEAAFVVLALVSLWRLFHGFRSRSSRGLRAAVSAEFAMQD